MPSLLNYTDSLTFLVFSIHLMVGTQGTLFSINEYHVPVIAIKRSVCSVLQSVVEVEWKFLPAGARKRLVLSFLYVFRICLFVIVLPHLSRTQYITSFVTIQLPCIAAFGGLLAKLQQMKVLVCCLDCKNLVVSCKDPGV